MPDYPAWQTPGTRVVIDSGRSRFGLGSGVIDRVTAKHLVLANGTRFRRDDLQQVGHDRQSMYTPDRILDPTDPRTAERWHNSQQRQLRRRIQNKVSELLSDFADGDPTAGDTALALLTDGLAKYKTADAAHANLQAAR